MLHLPKIALVPSSTVISADQIRTIALALQVQVSRDFAPAWGQDAIVSAFGPGEPVPPDWWQLVFADDSDQAGALGYHELAASGLPCGFVFAKTDQTYGLSSSVTASHELLEILADPWICGAALHQLSGTSGVIYALEVCDAVEDDLLGYDIDGVKVSDFVLPSFFRDGAPGPHSFRNNVALPFQLARGGYLSEFVEGQGWNQVNAEAAPTPRQLARQSKGDYSRTLRRHARKGD